MTVAYKVGDKFVDANGNEVEAPQEQPAENAPENVQEARSAPQDANAGENANEPQEGAENVKPAKRTIQAPKKDND